MEGKAVMAKALFQKGQRVFVKPVGVWAVVEQVLPQWVKGVEEPLKVFYDVGMGREFQNHELTAPPPRDRSKTGYAGEDWRVVRMKARYDIQGDSSRYPQGATYPIIVTDSIDWGGWRVPKAEYDRDPERIEFQSRAICQTLPLVRLARDLVEMFEEHPQKLGPGGQALAQRADELLRLVYREEDANAAPTEDLPPFGGRR
jgi:hypothetical protein